MLLKHQHITLMIKIKKCPGPAEFIILKGQTKNVRGNINILALQTNNRAVRRSDLSNAVKQD